MPRRSDMPDDPGQRDRRGTGGGSPRARRGWRRGRTEYARAGFTLVELLAVILIIGILVAIVINVSNRAMRKAAEQRTKTTMRVIMSALEIYREEFGVYPSFKVGNDYRAGNAKLYSLFWRRSGPASASGRCPPMPYLIRAATGISWTVSRTCCGTTPRAVPDPAVRIWSPPEPTTVSKRKRTTSGRTYERRNETSSLGRRAAWQCGLHVG